MLNKLPAIFIIGAAIAMLSGCNGGGSNATTTTSDPVVATGAATTLGVQAVDANTLEPITGATLTITDGTANFDSPHTTTLDADTDTAFFTMLDTVTPTTDNPITVSVRGAATDFLSSNQTIEITETGAADLEIPLVSVTGTQPEGVSANQISATSVDGRPSQPITASVGGAGGTDSGDESSSITINTDVQMTDANNNPVSGDLSVTTAFYDADSTDSLEAFPGGFNVAVANPTAVQNSGNNTDATGEIGTDGEVSFLSGGFTSIEITDANGNQVKNFSSPVPITMTVSDQTVNPDTGNTVQVGETLPIWSFDDGEGKWSYQGQGTVSDQTAGDGLFEVGFTTTHLTYFNLDWYRTGSKRCHTTISVFDNTGGTYPNRARVRIQVQDSRGRKRSSRKKFYFPAKGNVNLYNLPSDSKTVLTFYDIATDEVIGSVGSDLDNLCNSSSVTLTSPTLTKIDLTVRVVSSCSNDSSVTAARVPRTYVKLRRFFPTPRRKVAAGYTDDNGEITFDNLVVQAGSTTPTYILKVRNRISGGVRKETALDFNTQSNPYVVDFPQTCAVTTGSTGGEDDGGGSGN